MSFADDHRSGYTAAMRAIRDAATKLLAGDDSIKVGDRVELLSTRTYLPIPGTEGTVAHNQVPSASRFEVVLDDGAAVFCRPDELRKIPKPETPRKLSELEVLTIRGSDHLSNAQLAAKHGVPVGIIDLIRPNDPTR